MQQSTNNAEQKLTKEQLVKANQRAREYATKIIAVVDKALADGLDKVRADAPNVAADESEVAVVMTYVTAHLSEQLLELSALAANSGSIILLPDFVRQAAAVYTSTKQDANKRALEQLLSEMKQEQQRRTKEAGTPGN